MFDDLLEAWDALVEARGSTPEAERLTHRMGVAMTKQAKGKYDKSALPPIPGTPEHRRRNLLKGMGIKKLGMRTSGKNPPPLKIPKGTKVAGVDLGDAKGESFFRGSLHLWEDCDCGCNGKKGGCGKGKKKDLDEFGYWT